VPFGLFRKKEVDASEVRPAVAVPAAGTLSIQKTQELLRSIESERVRELSARLAPIKESAAQSLAVLGRLAGDMEHEKIKLEGIEQRFKSVAENARKTVVSSLRREVSTELLLPESANDAKRFKERLETMMNRFGEVSGSHSKVLNAFMKKHAGKMKDEFEVLTKLLNDTKTAMSDFEQKRAPIVKCNGILNTISQKIASTKSAEASVQDMKSEIGRIENELTIFKSQLDKLRNSAEFVEANSTAQRANDVANQQEQFHLQVTDLFSHVSRAFTKYSYGLTRETEARLHRMSDEPWKMLYESDLSPYSSLLFEIRKSIDSGKIQLKDSEKILQYLDLILKSIPELQSRAGQLRAETETLHQSDTTLVNRAKELEQRIEQDREELTKNLQTIDHQKRQIAEKRDEINTQINETEQILEDLTGQKYSLEY
jgi:predicted  nucleic acid-binding Zn-ribbon protein